MQLVLHLTRDCNLACRYCYQRHERGRGMDAEVVERAVRLALGLSDGHVSVTYFGGEPLLERETIERTLPTLRARPGALVTAKISTNGSLLDRSFAALARRHALFVSLSTDGAPAAQDAGRPTRGGGPSAPGVERALAALVAERAPFATYQVITPENAALLPRSTDWLFRRGARALVSAPDFTARWSEADLSRLERAYRGLARRYLRWTQAGVEFHLAPFDGKISARTRRSEHLWPSCSAGVRQLSVAPDGALYPCIEFVEHEDARIGDVWSGIDPARLARFRATLGGAEDPACAGCGIRERCASTCACLAFRLGGGAARVDALVCAHERLVTLAADRIGARLWRKLSPAFLRRQYDPTHHALSTLESLFEEARR